MNKQQMNLVIKTVDAYIVTNEDVLEKVEVKELKDLLGEIQTEQRLMLRTVMCTLLDDNTTVRIDDITNFYDYQVDVDNQVDPESLQNLADLMYTKGNPCMIGYSSAIDEVYWNGIIETLNCNWQVKSDIRTAFTQWIKQNS